MTNNDTTQPSAKPGRKMAREPKAGQAEEPSPKRPRSKSAAVLAMLQRPEGATLDQLVIATGWLPAGDLDHVARSGLRDFLGDTQQISQLEVDPTQHANLIASFGALAQNLDGMAIAELRKLLLQAELRVTVSRDAISAQFELAALAAWVGVDLDEHRIISLPIAASQATWGHEHRLRLDSSSGAPINDTNLVQLIARGFSTRDQLLAMSQEDVRAMPATQFRHLERIARLAYLAPDIVKAILDGQQPRQVTARFLSRLGALALTWSDQRKMLGFPAS